VTNRSWTTLLRYGRVCSIWTAKQVGHGRFTEEFETADLRPAKRLPEPSQQFCPRPLTRCPGARAYAPSLAAMARTRAKVLGPERAQKRHQILLLLRRQFRPEDQVKELDRVLQCQKTLVVQVARVVLGAAQRKFLIGPSPTAIMLLIITGSKKRSVWKLRIRLSV
jgi:hypothetical protein